MASRIEVILEAQNRASGEMAKFAADIEKNANVIAGRLDPAVQGASRNVQNFFMIMGRGGQDAERSSTSVNRLATVLSSQLSPGAGRAAGALAGVSGAATGMIAVITIAAAVAAKFVSVMADANLRTVELGRLQRSLDFSGIVGGLRSATRELDQFDNSLTGMMVNATRGIPGMRGALQYLMGRDNIETSIKEHQEAARATAGSELGQYTARARAALEGTRQEGYKAAIERATLPQSADLETITTYGSKTTSSIEKERVATLDAMRKKADQDVAQLTELGLGDVGGYIQKRLDLEIQAVEASAQEKFNALAKFIDDSRRKAMDVLVERDFGRQAKEQAPYAADVGAGGPLTADQAKEGRDYAHERASITLKAERDRIAAMGEVVTLSRSQAVNFEMQRVEAERLLAVEEARRDTTKIAAANVDAQIKAYNIMAAELERVNAGAGFGKAARQIEDEWSAAGRRAEDTFRGVAGTVQQTLATVLRGDNVGKDFGRNFLRSIQGVLADEASKMLVGSLVGGLRSILPGGGGGGSPLADILARFGGGGNAGPTDVTGASTSALASLQQRGYQLVGDAQGRTLAVQPGGVGVPSAGGYVAPDIPVASDQPTSFQTAGAGGGYASAGLSVAGAALAAYGVYESGSRGTDQAAATQSAAMTGAVSGISTGISVAGALGGLAGGVAGFAVFAVTSILGHFAAEEASDRKKKLERRIARKEQAGDVVQQIAEIVNNQNLSAEEMLERRIQVRHEEHTFHIIMGPRGPQSEIAMRSVPGPSTGGLLLSLAELRGATALSAFIRERGHSPEEIDVEHDLGIRDARGWINSAAELAASINDVDAWLGEVYAALQAALEREALERSVPFQYVEQGSGVRKTTQLVLGHIETGAYEPGSRDLMVSRDLYKRMGLDEAAVDRAIGRLNRATARRDMLIDINATRFLEAI